MTFQEKYDLVVALIEEHIDEKYSVISDIISKKLLINERALLDSFKFISGYTFAEYIGQRRLERVFLWKKEIGDSWDEAAFEFGEDYTSYFRRFKNTFGISPTEAINSDLGIHFLPPLYLEEIISTKDIGTQMNNNMASINETLQLTSEQYAAFDIIQNYQAMFGFNNQEIVKIYNLSEKYKLSMEELCKCREIEKIKEDDFTEEDCLPENVIKDTARIVKKYNFSCVPVFSLLRDGFNVETVFIVFTMDVRVEDASKFVWSMKNCDLSLEDIPLDVLNFYFSNANPYYIFGDVLSVEECLTLTRLAKEEKIDLLAMPEELFISLDETESLPEALEHYEGFLMQWDDKCDEIDDEAIAMMDELYSINNPDKRAERKLEMIQECKMLWKLYKDDYQRDYDYSDTDKSSEHELYATGYSYSQLAEMREVDRIELLISAGLNPDDYEFQ